MQKNRKRIAVFVNGGVISGAYDQGLPPVSRLITELSKTHDITLYSFAEIVTSSSFFGIRYVPAILYKIKGLNMLYLVIVFLFDHLKKPYNILHGIWGLPSGFFAVLLAKILFIKSIVTLMGGESANVPEIGFGGLISKKSRKLVIWMCENTDVLISISDFMMESLYKAGLKKMSNRHTISFGASSTFYPLNKEENKTVYNIIHIANLNEVKDQTTLLKAFKQILKKKDCILHIIGGDYLNEKIQKLALALGVNNKVVFHGILKYDDIATQLQKADLMIHSSLSEGQAFVFCEAMACGIPVCSTHTGLMADLSGSKCLTTPVRDYEGLAKNAIKVLNEKKLRNYLIENGLDWTNARNEKYTLQSYLNLYEKMN